MQQQLPQQHEARRIRCLLVASCAAGELGGRMRLQQRWKLRLAFSQPVYLSRQMYLPVLSVSVSVSAAAVDVSASGSESVDISAWEMRNFCLFNANASRDAPSPPTRHQFSITRAHTPSLPCFCFLCCCCHILLLLQPPWFTAHLLRHKLLQLKITLQQLLHLLMTTLAPKVVSTALGALTDELLIRKCFSLATLRFPLATVAVATDASSEKRANKASLSTTDKLAAATRTLNILCLNAPLDLFPR